MSYIVSLTMASVVLTIIFQFWSMVDRREWLIAPISFFFGATVAFGFSVFILRHF